MTSSLDELARLAQNGEATLQQLVEAFLETVVLIPSGSDPAQEGVQPVLVNVEDLPYLVVATGEAGLKHTQGIATFAVSLLGRDVLAGVQPGNGVVVNTEDSGFSLHPDMVRELLSAYNITSYHGEADEPAADTAAADTSADAASDATGEA